MVKNKSMLLGLENRGDTKSDDTTSYI